MLKLAVWEQAHHELSAPGPQQRSELRCQEGRFRDDNSPPAHTLRPFFHTLTHVHLPTRLLSLTSTTRLALLLSLSFPCLSFVFSSLTFFSKIRSVGQCGTHTHPQDTSVTLWWHIHTAACLQKQPQSPSTGPGTSTGLGRHWLLFLRSIYK